MDFDKVVEQRHSVRKYKPDAVPDEHIKALIHAARLAPSGSNLQPLRYIIAKTPEAVAAVSACTSVSFAANAPDILVCLTDTRYLDGLPVPSAGNTAQSQSFAEYDRKRRAWGEWERRAYLNLNAGIAIEHIVLKAVDLGLGSCWIRVFDDAKLREALQLDSRYDVVALLPVGYPESQPSSHIRLPAEELILREF